RKTTDEQDVRWIIGLTDVLRDGDRAGDDSRLPGSEFECPLGEIRRGADGELRPGEHESRDPWHPSRELDVSAPDLDDERLLQRRRDEAGRQPVCMHEVRIERGCGSAEVPEEGWKEHREPRTRLQVTDDPVAVGNAEVPER